MENGKSHTEITDEKIKGNCQRLGKVNDYNKNRY